MRSSVERMPRLWTSLRVILPAVWIGLVLGLSFIEPALKFQAPGITIPLGLGIGRLVFTALAITGAVLLLGMIIASFASGRETKAGWGMLGAIAVVLIVQSFVIRPLLSARSDVIIAGGEPGESWLHYGYIATDVILFALLVIYLVRTARRSIRLS